MQMAVRQQIESPVRYIEGQRESAKDLHANGGTIVGRAPTLVDLVRPDRHALEHPRLVHVRLAESDALQRLLPHRRAAHQIVGRLVLESVRAGRKPADWTPEELVAFAPEFTTEMARLLEPREGMKSREAPGGTGPTAVADALHRAEERLAGFTR